MFLTQIKMENKEIILSSQNFNSNNPEKNHNSSINDKQRKLYLKVNSLISSAENFETLKLYEDALKLFNEAGDLVRSLLKKQNEEDHAESSIKNFFSYFESHIKSKIKSLEQFIIIQNSIKNIDNPNTPRCKSSRGFDVSVLSKFHNSSIPQSHTEIKINPNPLDQKQEVLKLVDNLIKSCDSNIKELEDQKKIQINLQQINLNKTILMDATMINQNSFYIPQLPSKLPMQQEYFYNMGNNLKQSSLTNNLNIDDGLLLEKIEEKFKIIHFKLCKLKGLFDNDKVLQERKTQKQKKLENLKSSYSAMKKIYENAIRNGLIIR